MRTWALASREGPPDQIMYTAKIIQVISMAQIVGLLKNFLDITSQQITKIMGSIK